MRIYDIIAKKRDNLELTTEEINFFIKNYTNGLIPDYQAAALLMAIYFNGLSERETLDLTLSMAHSGEIIDLSTIKGIKVDKHSTGGVGDKTTLIIAPIIASLGVKIAKMSGKGLGHTGGTADKLNSIPGFKTNIKREDCLDIVNKIGISLVTQSGNITPADKKLYALRDVTATVNSIPLIVSSIMSKKIASGADAILLDVKVGNGAFMKNLDDAIKLSSLMVKIGYKANKKTIALVTDMNQPLGNAVGNSLEVLEALEVLKGNGPDDLKNLCIDLASYMLFLADFGSLEKCKESAKYSLEKGLALAKFKELITIQSGNINFIFTNGILEHAKFKYEFLSNSSGFINSIDTEKIGIASMTLGAGRKTKDDTIDYSAGLILNKKIGDFVNKGDSLVSIYTNDLNKYQEALSILKDAFHFSSSKPEKSPLIYAKITKDSIIKF